MKKCFRLFALVLCLALLSACGSGAATGSAADYSAVIASARTAEINEAGLYGIVTGPEDLPQYNLIFYETSPFKEEDMQRYAISMPGIITMAYGVAIILPAPGKEQAVLEAVNAFVLKNQKDQANYLRPQYEIAMAAIVKTAKTGEVLLAMCEGAESVMESMEKALAA